MSETPAFFPDRYAAEHPDKPAYVMAGSGETISYSQLVERSRRAAHAMRALGTEPGACVAIMMENHPRYLELAWAAQRAGLRYTAISPRLTASEVAYVLEDSGTGPLFVSETTAAVAREAAQQVPAVSARIAVDGDIAGFESYDRLVAGHPATPLDDEAEGLEFLYSSGTTGRPKAIKAELALNPIGTPPTIVPLFRRLYGFGSDTVYLSPAPLYHSAPLRFNMAVHRLGGTTIVMEKFDAASALELIERYRVTHAQMVPTMFIRMLRLPEEERLRHDLSSLRAVIHAAAPCPIDVKREMIEWLGPIIYEYYSATEVYLLTAIDSEEWLAHPGSVGRAHVGTPHVLDDEGNGLPPGRAGTIWSEGGLRFEYHNAPEKTAESRNERGWTTVGDVGYLDADAYLYLTDRKADMIISGGVNIYPQEAENILVAHPAVADAAVFGIPHPELGEEVKGVVQVAAGASPSPELKAELLSYCHQRVAKYKCPRTIDFVDQLPREPTGKLYKRLLRERYAAAGASGPDGLDPADRFVSAAGLGIRVRVTGAGPPLLMISGLGANIELWEPLTPLLASRRLIRFDAPGSGLSTVPDRRFRMRGLADVVAAMLDCLDLPSVDVLGYSLGGALAQELAHRHPRRLRKLILAGTIPGVGAIQNPRTVIEFFDPRLAVAGSERRMRRLARLVGGRASANPPILAAYENRRLRHPPSLAGYRFQLRAILGWSSVAWLHTLTAPTLVLAAGRDPIVPLVNSRIFTRLIPDCRRYVVADGGHLFMVDQPEDVAPVIEAFLSES